MHEDDEVARTAAEALASHTAMTIDQALQAIAFQGTAHDVIDRIEDILGDASGDVWFDWSDGRGRLKIGVTTRAKSSTIGSVMSLLQSAELTDRADLVRVVWSTRELEAGQERADERLKALGLVPWYTGRDPEANSIVVEVPDDLTAEQLKVVEAAVRATGVSVLVTTGAGWAVPAST
jgi:hypothetical protein